jgi:hypothetical protein
MPSFTLTVNGSGFTSNSSIIFDGKEKAAEWVSTEQLTCRIEPGDITVNAGPSASQSGSGTASDASGVELPVMVRNPGPGGGDSNIVNFLAAFNFTFDTPYNFHTQENSSAGSPYIAVDPGGGIAVGWSLYSYIFDGNRVYFGRSEDSGASWAVTRIFSTSIASGCSSHLALDDDGNIYMAWSATEDETYMQKIFFSASNDNGTTWTPDIEISKTFDWCWAPRIAAGRQENTQSLENPVNLYIVWAETFQNQDRINISRSNDSGAAWTGPVGIPGLSSGWFGPVLALGPEGNLYIISQGDENDSPALFFSYSTDSGVSWSTPASLCDAKITPRTMDMAAAGDGSLALVWNQVYSADPNYRPLYFYRLDEPTGDISGCEAMMVPTGHHQTKNPAIAIDGAGNINLVWLGYDSSKHYFNVYFSRSIDNGVSWTPPLAISDTAYDISGAGIAVDSAGNVNVTWIENGLYDAYLYFTGSAR